MCGICGIYDASQDTLVNKKKVQVMLEAIAHRGSDDLGIYISSNQEVILGHNRLAIVDLSSKAQQPMCNEDQTLWIVFNGEIYNNCTLRIMLLERGHSFKSNSSDTEVILHAFEEWGIECVKQLRGDFAFALWDEQNAELYLVRDRLGVKPIFYTQIQQKVLFASEVKSLLVAAESYTIREESIYHYLTFLTVPAPYTMFEDIYKLEAGTILQVTRQGTVNKYRYWDIADYLNDPVFDAEETAYKITKQLTEEAIHLRTMSDVPIAYTLSSGVDSSLIAALVRKQTDRIMTITMDYEVQSDFSEGHIAKIINEKLLIDHYNIIQVTNDQFVENMQECFLRYTDYPVATPDIILQYLISKYLKEMNYKVCMFGEGADELGGYPSYGKMQDEYKLLHYFNNLPHDLKATIFKSGSEQMKDKLGIALGDSVISRKHIQAFSEEEKKIIWGGADHYYSYSIISDLMKEVEVDTADSFIRMVINVEYKLRLPEFMLSRIDYATMLNTVEARVPFMDYRLVEYSSRLPMNIRMKNNEPKYLIKKMLTEHLEQELVYRKKLGFGKVLIPLLNEVIPGYFREQILNQSGHPIFEYLKQKQVRQLYEERQSRRDGGFKLWTLYSLGKWLELYC